jgi:hypothetical protein
MASKRDWTTGVKGVVEFALDMTKDWIIEARLEASIPCENESRNVEVVI